MSDETSKKLTKILRKRNVSSEIGSASSADKNGCYVGGKPGTAESHGNNILKSQYFYFSLFQLTSQIMRLFVMLENPKTMK